MYSEWIWEEMGKVNFWPAEDCVILVESSGNSARVVQCGRTVRCGSCADYSIAFR
jgi:hypothetical protein